MGSDAEDSGDDEQPVHRVELSSFYIGNFLVIQ